MMSTELMVPAALTLADSSATIDSGPCGVSIRTLGGAPTVYPEPPFVISTLRRVLIGCVTIPVAPPTSL